MTVVTTSMSEHFFHAAPRLASLTCVSPPGTHSNPRAGLCLPLAEKRTPRAGGFKRLSQSYPVTRWESQFLKPDLLNLGAHMLLPGPSSLDTVLHWEETEEQGFSPFQLCFHLCYPHGFTLFSILHPRDRTAGYMGINVYTLPHASDMTAPKGRRPQRCPNTTVAQVQETQ